MKRNSAWMKKSAMPGERAFKLFIITVVFLCVCVCVCVCGLRSVLVF